MDEDKRAFWDDFSSLADERSGRGGGGLGAQRPSAIGTSAMGHTNLGAAAGRQQGQQGQQGQGQQQKDEWDDW